MCPLMSSGSALNKAQIMVPETPTDRCKARVCVKGEKNPKLIFFYVNTFILEKESLGFLLVSSLILFIKDLILCHSSA